MNDKTSNVVINYEDVLVKLLGKAAEGTITPRQEKMREKLAEWYNFAISK